MTSASFLVSARAGDTSQWSVSMRDLTVLSRHSGGAARTGHVRDCRPPMVTGAGVNSGVTRRQPGTLLPHGHLQGSRSVDALSFTRIQAAAHDVSPFRNVVDVGGGHGALLAALLKSVPAAQGILFDLPKVFPLNLEARSPQIDAGLAPRHWLGLGCLVSSHVLALLTAFNARIGNPAPFGGDNRRGWGQKLHSVLMYPEEHEAPWVASGSVLTENGELTSANLINNDPSCLTQEVRVTLGGDPCAA